MVFMGMHEKPRWLRHPQAAALLRFDQLPSVFLHPSRIDEHMPPAAHALLRATAEGTPAWFRLHRYWSQSLALSLDLAQIKDAEDPALCIAALPPSLWERLLRLAGATLAAPQLRRVIAGEHVRAIEKTLGGEALDYICRSANPAHPGLPQSLALAPATLAASCLQWGAALAARTLDACAPATAQRARLRLPQQAIDAIPEALSPISAAAALGLLLGLVERMDASWHSSFRAAR